MFARGLYTKIPALLIRARIYMKSKCRYVTLIRADDDGEAIFSFSLVITDNFHVKLPRRQKNRNCGRYFKEQVHEEDIQNFYL